MKTISRILTISFLLGSFTIFPARSQSIEKLFKTPPATARPYTWWHWVDGNVSREGITKDLEMMKAVGIGGFHLFDGGLGFPQGPVIYNSEKYHEMVSFAFSEAQRLGLDGGFNNASGWSSTGGPWIAAENSMKTLVWSELKLHGSENNLIVLAHPEISKEQQKGKDPKKYDFYRDIAVLAFPTPKDDYFRLKDWQEKSLFSPDAKADKFVPDLSQASLEAIIPKEKILNLTSRMDAEGKLDWVSPPGNWTVVRIGYTTTGAEVRPGSKGGIGLEVDKLSRKAVDIHWDALINKIIADSGGEKSLSTVLIDSYEVGMDNWTEGFGQEFQKLRGYDLIPYLICMTGRILDNTETTERFLWDMRTTVAELMQENYFGYFAEKCHERGLKLAIEPYGSGTFDAPATTLLADIPMTEFWDIRVRNLWQWTSLVVPSGAHLSGRSVVGAESFTSMTGNFNDSPYELKQYGDWAFARGVNRYYFHTMVHQPWNDAVKPGMTFGRFGGNYNRNNTWYPKSKAWMEYIARCQFIFQRGTYQADALALYGDERAFNNFLAPTEPVDIKTYNGINIDLGGMTSLNDLSIDANGDIRVTFKGKLLDTRYKFLLLRRADLMLPENVAKLGELADKGAKIFASKPLRTPTLSKASEADKSLQTLTKKYWESGLIHEPNEFEMAIKGIVPDCETQDSILFNRTRIDANDYYFISNQSRKYREVTCYFRVSGKQPEIWDPMSGQISKADNWKALVNGRTEVRISMSPVGSVFVVFRKSTTLKGINTTQHQSKSVLELNGKWTVSFDPSWGPKQPVTFDGLSPWNENANEEIRYYSGSAIYKTEFTLSKSQKSELKSTAWLDLGRVEIFAKVKLNGKELGTLWKPPYILDISKVAHAGINILEVEVTNLWVNRLIGDERYPDFDKKSINWLQAGQLPPADAPRKTFLINKPWKKQDKLLPSGLIGPVFIEAEIYKKQ